MHDFEVEQKARNRNRLSVKISDGAHLRVDPNYGKKEEKSFAPSSIFDSWIPITIRGDTSDGQPGLACSVKIRTLEIHKMNKYLFVLTFRKPDMNEVWPTSSIPFLLKYFNVNAFIAAKKFKNLVKKRNSSDSTNAVARQKKSTILEAPQHASKQYAQQTNDHQIYRKKSTFCEGNFKERHPKNVIVPKLNHLSLNKVRQEEAIHADASDSLINSREPKDHENSNSCSFNRSTPKEEIPNIQDFIPEVDFNSSMMQHSRFIHHNINFKGIKRLIVVLFLPFILLQAFVTRSYLQESSFLKRFQSISSDLAVLDACEYTAWSIFLLTHYVNIKRLVIEGRLTDDAFSKFGIDSLIDHLNSMMENEEIQDQLNSHFLRLRRGIYKSKFYEKYDLKLIESSYINIKVFDPSSNQLTFRKVKTYDGLRLAQEFIDQMMLDHSMESIVIGENERGLSQTEELMRYNCLNPVLQILYNSSH